MVRSMVSSNRIAPKIFSPVNAGLEMIRVLMACTSSYILVGGRNDANFALIVVSGCYNSIRMDFSSQNRI
jgi:hypothetical protein